MPRPFYWEDMTTEDFASVDPETIAILPIAATEQHGPHLPVATDSAISVGMIELLRDRLPVDISVLVLPHQKIGKSNEHMLGPGTLTLAPKLLISAWRDIGAAVSRTGLRKILIVNSHGGNNAIMDIVTRELRVRFAMLAVATQWSRFGTPAGLIDDEEKRYGIHAGKVETSLMLHFRPDLVRMEKARNFASATQWMESTFKHLRATGQHNMGWIIHDMNRDGAVGDAAAGTSEIGSAIAGHQVSECIELLKDMNRFDLGKLATAQSADCKF